MSEASAVRAGAASEGEGRGSQQYLTFQLAGEMYAIGILQVKEIIEFGGLTAVPKMHRFVRGVINLRGHVVSVLDLAARFGHEHSPVTRRTCIVIVEMRTREGVDEIGMIVDSVTAVQDIAAEQVEPPPAFGGQIRADFVRGMGKLGHRFIVILDMDRVLSVEELADLTPI